LHRAQAAFYAGGDRPPLRELLTDDVVWRVSGNNSIAGTYRGIDEVMRYFSARRDLAGRTFRLHPGDVLVGEGEVVAALTDGTALIAGNEYRWSTIGLYRFRNGLISECRLVPFDLAEFDRIWGDAVVAAADDGLPRLGRLAASISQFANKRGVYLGRRSTRIHVAIYRRSGGKLGGHLPGWPQARILLLDHTGAKTGMKRTSPLMYHEEEDTFAVMASKGGQLTHPAWLHNVIANPDTSIQIGPEIREVRARVATDEERERLWPEFIAFYPGYEFFQRHAQGRKIPMVILEPR
jgi:deazaflavin-dependent oxidoreductase (nitroreductase family)